jgi:hypothetical protein
MLSPSYKSGRKSRRGTNVRLQIEITAKARSNQCQLTIACVTVQ